MAEGGDSRDALACADGAKILGQWFGYPRTFAGAATVIGVILILAILLGLYLSLPERSQSSVLKAIGAVAVLVHSNGASQSIEQQGQMVEVTFWTPAEETAADLKAEEERSKKQTDKERQWEAQVSEAKLTAFGNALIRTFPQEESGFHRSSVIGLGRSRVLKHGWWWTVTVPESDYNSVMQKIGIIYRTELGAEAPILFEGRIVNAGYRPQGSSAGK